MNEEINYTDAFVELQEIVSEIEQEKFRLTIFLRRLREPRN